MEKPDLFEQENKTFDTYLPFLLAKEIGGFVVVKETDIQGPFVEESDAFKAAYGAYGNTHFLVREVTETPKNYYINNVAAA